MELYNAASIYAAGNKKYIFFRAYTFFLLSLKNMAFNCQRCKQPLRIDDTLNDLDSAATELLVGKYNIDIYIFVFFHINDGRRFTKKRHGLNIGFLPI